ncbi:MAG: hypothetical protein RMZ41_029210 [Nostoc sp. DedVER02]|nr:MULTISPECIES: hypothetical protein [unclassified Nostoc]MDZ7985161.1 hypothetical protein [Nostoc sp. DedVER02]MDZ8113283.1 hypothetical protein [Nostoc sp. DedVER01b]
MLERSHFGKLQVRSLLFWLILTNRGKSSEAVTSRHATAETFAQT